jgi:hypothetical protein
MYIKQQKQVVQHPARFLWAGRNKITETHYQVVEMGYFLLIASGILIARTSTLGF